MNAWCTAAPLWRIAIYFKYDRLEMNEDENARKMCLHIDRSFRAVVGNDSVEMARRWAQSIAETVGISPYRIKNPVVATGKLPVFVDYSYPLVNFNLLIIQLSQNVFILKCS